MRIRIIPKGNNIVNTTNPINGYFWQNKSIFLNIFANGIDLFIIAKTANPYKEPALPIKESRISNDRIESSTPTTYRGALYFYPLIAKVEDSRIL